MSVLVNGSTTQDFKGSRDLRQGDPLSPFLFSIVVEGLASVVRKASRLGILSGFKLNDEVSNNLLQFAEETILVCDKSWLNIWGWKAILRGFEMLSGLKINSWKSYLYGVEVEESFMMPAAQFLAYKKEVLPFKFLGLTVGGNHK